MNVADLFAGCGGLSLGFRQAGFDLSLAVDNCKDCSITYNSYFPDTPYILKDIRDITPEEILDAVNGKKIDGVIGGPPCQGFSISGKRIFIDPRNSLYLEYFRIIDILKPEFCVLENVPGLLRLYDGKAFKLINHEFIARGYTVFEKILSADNFGVPQTRKRTFLVGMKGKPFGFPSPEKKKLTLWDAIGDLPEPSSTAFPGAYSVEPLNEYQKEMRARSSVLFNHQTTLHTVKTKKIISLVPEGGNYKNLPPEFADTRKVHIAWTRLDGSAPCTTIDTGHRHHFHPKENRVLTVRESARVQSFPDGFIFKGSKTSQYRQVGNAVPPLLARKIAEKVKEALSDNIRDSATVLF